MTTATRTTTTATVIDRFGAVDVLRPAKRQVAAAASGQVRIRVAAAAINPVDLQTRSGRVLVPGATDFPLVLGWDVAGTVEQLGDDVDGFAVGDRVAAMTFQPVDQNGTYAMRIVLDAALLASVPDGLALERAATVPLAGLTASQLVEVVGLSAGATLLVDGPTGSVGGMAVQLAAGAGIDVIAVANADDEELVRSLGASAIVPRGDFTADVRALHPGGVDAAIDVVGRDSARAALAAVRDGGTFATVFTDYDDHDATIEPERGIRVEELTVRPDTPQLARLLTAADRGELRTAIAATFPLAEAAEAHRRLEQGGVRGKLVLVP